MKHAQIDERTGQSIQAKADGDGFPRMIKRSLSNFALYSPIWTLLTAMIALLNPAAVIASNVGSLFVVQKALALLMLAMHGSNDHTKGCFEGAEQSVCSRGERVTVLRSDASGGGGSL